MIQKLDANAEKANAALSALANAAKRIAVVSGKATSAEMRRRRNAFG